MTKQKTTETARPHEWLDTTWPGYPHLEQCMFCAIPRIPETENTDCPKRPTKKESLH